MLKGLIIGVLATAFAGCTSVNVVTMAPRVEAPDVVGRTGILGGIDNMPAREIQLSPDASARPPVISGLLQDGTDDLFAVHGGASLGKKFEVTVNLADDLITSGCVGAMGKYQITGQSREEPSPGDVPVGVFAHYEDCSSKSTGNQNGLFGPGGYNWSASATSRLADAGVSIGYRLLKRALVYVGISAGIEHADLSINQDPSSNGISPGGSYSSTQDFGALSEALGFNLGSSGAWFNVHLNYSHFNLTGSNPDNLALSLGFGFGFATGSNSGSDAGS